MEVGRVNQGEKYFYYLGTKRWGKRELIILSFIATLKIMR